VIVGTNGIVLDERGRVLLIRRDDILTWALPGGASEPGELPPDGVAREVEEETGVKVIPERLPWPFLSLQRERLDQALRHDGGPPHWGRQRPSRWLRFARRTAGTVIYRWQDLKRHRRNLPPYQPQGPGITAHL